MRRLLILIHFFAIAYGAFAQNGFVSGEVILEVEERRIAHCTIGFYEDQKFVKGVAAGLDGSYSIELSPGVYSVIINHINYGKDTTFNVTIEGEDTLSMDLIMSHPCPDKVGKAKEALCPYGHADRVVPKPMWEDVGSNKEFRRLSRYYQGKTICTSGMYEVCKYDFYCKKHEISF